MPADLVTASELARELGVSPAAIAKARNSGRLTPIDGKFDLAVARIQWNANRKRAPRSQEAGPSPAVAAHRSAETPAGVDTAADYWTSKARREAAEAELAELKAAEQRGELVRKVRVERELAGRLVALRESLEALADRLAPVLAAEPNAGACRRLIRDEHRAALAGFTAELSTAVDAEDGDDGSA